MDHYSMDDVKRMLRTVSEIMRAGLKENATPEEREKMHRLVSDDLKVSGAMIESILAAGHENEDM